MSYPKVATGLLLLLFSLFGAATLTVMLNWHSSVMYALFLLVLLLWLASRYSKSGMYALGIFCLSVATFYFLLTPDEQFPPQTRWESNCARLPKVEELPGDKIKILGVRDFKYRTETDFEARYQDVTYELARLQSVDIYLSHWDGMDEIAHTLLRFDFSDGKSVVLSVEMRCPDGTSRDYYTTFFKQHALIYIWGTPEDLCDLRSRFRGEATYRYRTTLTPEESRTLFLTLVDRTADLSGKQEFYRVITGNCTTELLPYLKAVRPKLRWDIRALINGPFDRLLFEQGVIAHEPGELFEAVRARSFIKNNAVRP